LIVFPISMDAVVLSPLVPVVGAAAPLVVVGVVVVVVVELAGGLAVELQPASRRAVTAGATVRADNVDRWSMM
jgi:hypothetical protein